MNLDEFVRKHRPQIESTLFKILDTNINKSHFEEEIYGLHKIKDTVTGGKLLRGIMVLISAKIHGKTIDNQVYTTAAIIELLHTMLLIQDDIMDRDTKRRNKDSIYYQYVKDGQKEKATDSLLYGQSMAICLSDVCFFMSIKTLAQTIKDPLVLKRIIEQIGIELQDLAPAQMLDQKHGFLPIEPTEDEIIKKYIYKTAHYSFSLPLIIGSLFAPKQNLKLIQQFGEDVGIIFQLKDDELGMFGDEHKIGKPIGSDIRENKKTLMRHYLLQDATPGDRKKLISIFGNANLQPKDIEFVRGCIKTYMITKRIQSEISKRQKNIHKTLNKMSQAGLDTQLLEDIVLYNLERTT